MDVKAAVAGAKKEIAELFADEGIQQVGLEAVEFDDAEQAWIVTIGFLRPWETPPNTLAALVGQGPSRRRVYKVVRIADATGQVLSMRSAATETT
jgi:hypothetical protein